MFKVETIFYNSKMASEFPCALWILALQEALSNLHAYCLNVKITKMQNNFWSEQLACAVPELNVGLHSMKHLIKWYRIYSNMI